MTEINHFIYLKKSYDSKSTFSILPNVLDYKFCDYKVRSGNEKQLLQQGFIISL